MCGYVRYVARFFFHCYNCYMYQNKTEMNKREIAEQKHTSEATKEDNNGNNDEHFQQLNDWKWKQNETFCVKIDENETDNCFNRFGSKTCTIRFKVFKWLAHYVWKLPKFEGEFEFFSPIFSSFETSNGCLMLFINYFLFCFNEAHKNTLTCLVWFHFLLTHTMLGCVSAVMILQSTNAAAYASGCGSCSFCLQQMVVNLSDFFDLEPTAYNVIVTFICLLPLFCPPFSHCFTFK